MLEVTKNDGTFTIEEIDLTMWGDTREVVHPHRRGL